MAESMRGAGLHESTSSADEAHDATASPEAFVSSYARSLLHACGGDAVAPIAPGPVPGVQIDWAESGAMALTGPANGLPCLAPGPLTHALRGAIAALASLCGDPAARRHLSAIDAPALLGERAALAGLRRAGRHSPGGSARLLRARNGWLAVQLARPEDVALIPAWLQIEPEAGGDVWARLERLISERDAAQLEARARLLGMPVAQALEPSPLLLPWLRRSPGHAQPATAPRPRPRVLDLSSLWAGPLAASLLAIAGADVVKLESRGRPDGARLGPRRFFDLMNAQKKMVSLDFETAEDRRILLALIRRADIVIESARPRAMRQLGIEAETIVGRCPGLCWLSITGYGRSDPEGDWVAFGDDAAAHAGLAMATGGPAARPLFCGDAIADPLTGAHAAVAGLAAHLSGRGGLLDVSLRGVAAHSLAGGGLAPNDVDRASSTYDVAGTPTRAVLRSPSGDVAVRPPRARPADRRAATSGADTGEVLTTWLLPEADAKAAGR